MGQRYFCVDIEDVEDEDLGVEEEEEGRVRLIDAEGVFCAEW